MYHNEMPNPTLNPADVWVQSNLGDVFGIALDDLAPPNIYLTSTSIYEQPFTVAGRIHRLDRLTGAISVFQTLPNSGPGLGNIAFDRDHHQFFVTNHEDGRIYRLSFAGSVLSTFDPFAPDDGQPGFCPLGERLWGVGVYASRVYFGVWVEDQGRPTPPADNAVYSVGLDGSGDFVPADTTSSCCSPMSPPSKASFSSPVSDIAFAPDGRMMLAERTMLTDEISSAHFSRIVEYSGGHLNWTPTAATFAVGVAPGANAAGGVDYDCFNPGPCRTVSRVWGTGDILVMSPYVYGLQGLPEAGGDLSESYVIDLDGVLSVTSKSSLGDVEIRSSCPAAPCPDGPVAAVAPYGIPCEGTSLLLDGLPSTSCVGSGLEYRWSKGATVLCDCSTTPTCSVTSFGPILFTLEVRCLDPTRVCTDSLSLDIYFLPSPTAELIVPPSICLGDAVVLDASLSSALLCSAGLGPRTRESFLLPVVEHPRRAVAQPTSDSRARTSSALSSKSRLARSRRM